MELSYKIWGGPDGLSLEHDRRNKIKEAGRQKQFTKKITGLSIKTIIYNCINFISQSRITSTN